MRAPRRPLEGPVQETEHSSVPSGGADKERLCLQRPRGDQGAAPASGHGRAPGPRARYALGSGLGVLPSLGPERLVPCGGAQVQEGGR